jgi:glycosyltransferase involved in cell wall biosynthesis
MKILHVINSPFVLPYFFGEQFIYFNSLNPKYEIYIACADEDMLYKYEKKMHFNAIPISITRNFGIVSDIRVLFELRRAIKKHNIDIVVGHTPKAGFIAMLSAYLCNVNRRIYFRHGFLFQTAKGLKKYLLISIEMFAGHFANKVVCVSHSVLKESVEKKLSKKNNTIVINNGSCNGVDVYSKFNPDLLETSKLDSLKNTLNIKPNDFVVGYVGRIVKDKGIEELLNAWKNFSIDKQNTKLLIIGPFESRNSISSSDISYIHVSKNVIHVDFTENTQYYYALMNVFILPSKREGLPTVVLEASSMKIPVITTKVTGCIDSIVDNNTGFFVELNAKSIIEKLNTYYTNPLLTTIHGTNGREFITANFDQKKIWNYMIDNLYK